MEATISTGAGLGMEHPLRVAMVPEYDCNNFAPTREAMGKVWLLRKKYALLKERLEQAGKTGSYAEQQRIRHEMRGIATALGISQSLL